MMRFVCVAIVSFTLASGCCKSKSEPAPSKGSKPGDVTITTGPDGGVRVTGGGPMTGNPKDCAAFNACCTSPEAGLFCGLVKASGDDCTKAVTSVRSFLKEKGAALPEGCM